MKRFFASLLAVLMLVTMIPVSAMAADTVETEVTETETETETEATEEVEPEVVTHTVTFIVGKSVYLTAEVEDGDTVADPGKPRVRGYLFKAFFTKPDGGKRFKFDTPITEDTVLYARFIPISLLFGAMFRNDVEIDPEVPAEPECQHEWGEYEIIREPSCVDGSKTRTCTKCDATETATIPATGHVYDESTGVCACGAKKTQVATAAELKQMLNNFGAAGAGNNVVELTASITLSEPWTPVVIDGYNGADVITVNGNGHTIKGLTAPLFAGGFAGGSGVIINDLTIEDSTIVSTNTLGSGAFIETIDSMDVITLKNCHVKNSSITGSRTGGLIGWNSGYDNQNDGAVKTCVTIEDCSVVGCTITGDGTVGGIVGHAGGNAWTWNTIKNCKVENCTLTSNDDSYRVGAIVGTANVGHVVIDGCTNTGNTIKQNDNGTEIPRPADQSPLYGRFVPVETGKLTINGTAIQP